jgi:hypothetical protein
LHAQHLDLIYSQLGTLYDIIPNSPRSLKDPRKPNPGPHVDGVVGFVSHASINQLVDQMGQMSIKSHPSASGTSAQTVVVPTQTSEVNLVQSMQPKNPQQPGGKKKRNKKKIPILRKGLPPPKTPRREALRRKGRVIFPAQFVGRTTLLTSVLKG